MFGLASLCLDSRPCLWNNQGMRQRNRYRNYISMEVLVVLVVLGSFKFIPNLAMAAIVAGSAFLVSTGVILWFEKKQPDYLKRSTFWGAALFMVFGVLPILALRLANQPVELFHKVSNYLFLILLVCLFVDSYRENRDAEIAKEKARDKRRPY